MRRISEKQKKVLEERKKDTIRQFNFFITIWGKRDHRSEISKRYLGKEALSVFFHHILPKENYPQARYDENNIILVTFDEHQKVENDSLIYSVINERREKLKIIYD